MSTALLMLSCSVSIGCGGSAKNTKQAGDLIAAVQANSLAVSRLAQGVQAINGLKNRTLGIQRFREAIGFDKNMWEAHYNLGLALATDGNLSGAESSLSEAYRLMGDASEVVLALSEVRRRRGEWKAAGEILATYIEEHPLQTELRSVLVSTLRDGGRILKDKSMVDRAIALNPALEAFLGQDKDDHTGLSDSFTRLEALLNQGMIQ